MDPEEIPFVGRDAELSQLRTALQATARGAGDCLVVEGPAGIGKSRLLAAARDEAACLNVPVAAGRATQLDRVAPLSTLLMAIRTVSPPAMAAAELDELADNRFRMVDRLGELIEDYVRSRALLIVVDDAQWADELTALALRVLVPALSSSSVLWLLAHRARSAESPAQDAIDWLISEGARQVRLGPLSGTAAARLCGVVLGAIPDPSVLAVLARTGGNPFLLEQLLTTLRDAGQVVVVDGIATLVAGELPSSFLAVVDQRLRVLPKQARQLLEAGSVLGRPFTVHEAAGLVQSPPAELITAAGELVAAGALVDDGRNWAFRHDLIREVVYNNLASPVRLALHGQAAGVLEACGRSPVEVAEHLSRSDRAVGKDAIRMLRDAAIQVAPTAPGMAADLLRRVLDLIDDQDESRPALVAEAVRLLADAGRAREATELGESALRVGLDARDAATMLLSLAEALRNAGHNAAVVTYTRQALARTGVPEAARSRLLAVQAHGLLHVDDIEGADLAGAEAAALGAAVDEAPAVVLGTVARSVVARLRGQLDESVRYAREAVQIADHAGGEALERQPRLWLARGLAAVDRFAEADTVHALGQRESDQLGAAWSKALWHLYRAELRRAAGRLDDAQAEAEAGVRVTRQLTAFHLTVPLLALLTRLAIRRDEMAAARDYLRQGQRLLAGGYLAGPTEMTWSVALYEDVTGQPRAAAETLAEVYDGMPERMVVLPEDPEAGPVMVRIALRAGSRRYAEAAAAAARRLADDNPTVSSLAGAACHADGLLADDVDTLRAAVRHYRSSPRPLARAAALEDTAVAEHAVGRRREAVALLDEALGHYLTSGARRDVARVQQRLRGFGARDSRPGVTPSCDWTSLTQSEIRVVQLIAEGLTNRETADRLFLSPHTVDSHLRHVFAKLGVSSRVQLTRRFTEGGG